MMDTFTLSRRAAIAGLAASAARPAWSTEPSGEVRLGRARVAVEGRYALSQTGALRLGFPGIALRMAADTPRLIMQASATSPDCFIAISVDGGPSRTVRLAKGPQEITVFDGAPGRHRVEIVRRTESWQGQMEVTGFTAASGGSVRPMPPPSARRLLFIGDSITCGAGLDATLASTNNGPECSDGSRAFGKLVAKQLNASCHLVSYGGKGVIRDWQGLYTELTAPQFYERAMPDDPAAPWDHRRYVPHAVGVCLGTNDFNKGIPDRETFVGAYTAFGRKILHDAPGAKLLLIDSPMTVDGDDHRRTVQIDYIVETVRRLNTPRATHAPISHQPGRKADAHPIYPQHEAIAAELLPRFRAATGWS